MSIGARVSSTGRGESPFHCAESETGNEAIEKEVVEECHRDGDDHRGGHQ